MKKEEKPEKPWGRLEKKLRTSGGDEPEWSKLLGWASLILMFIFLSFFLGDGSCACWGQ